MTPPLPTIPAETSDGNLKQLLYALVAEQPFFKGLEAHQLQLLTDSAMEMKFETGQKVFESGSPANRFYLILEGQVAIESELAEHGALVRVQTLGPGDNLGWSWLFPPYLWHFSAHAVTPTRTIFFYATRLREQCEQDHELGYQLMQRVAEVAAESLRATQQRMAECADTRKTKL